VDPPEQQEPTNVGTKAPTRLGPSAVWDILAKLALEAGKDIATGIASSALWEKMRGRGKGDDKNCVNSECDEKNLPKNAKFCPKCTTPVPGK